MAKLRSEKNQYQFDFGAASVPSISANEIIPNAGLPEVPEASALPVPPLNPADDLPVPKPIESAITRGVFGTHENGDPVEPSGEEVEEISRLHGERLAELFRSLDHVEKLLRSKGGNDRESSLREKERLTCQVQGMLALYAEDFGETAARHLESWARAEAGVGAREGPPIPPEMKPEAVGGPQYGEGHPWHYLTRGDAAKPFSVDEIPTADCDGSFVGKLPKDLVKRRAKLSQLLVDQTKQLDDDKAKYQEVLTRGANALSEYDRAIAYGGDLEMAVASTLALKFNHISNGLGRVKWLREKLGLSGKDGADKAQPAATSTRAEKLERIHETVDQALNQLASALEAGKSETLKAWLKTMGRFHDYSLNNQMLIAWQRPNATHVAGFHAWKKFNRLVNKGEKGIMILAPVTKVVGKLERKDEQGITETPIRKLVNTKVVYVFDVSQTHGDPLPELPTARGDPAEHLDALKRLIESNEIELYYANRLHGGAQGLSEGGRIGIQKGLGAAEEFRTLVHELAHELLHRGERRKETTKRSRELEAEAVAFVVCNTIGLDVKETSSDYIQLYRGDKAALLESLQFIRTISREILMSLLPRNLKGTS